MKTVCCQFCDTEIFVEQGENGQCTLCAMEYYWEGDLLVFDWDLTRFDFE